MLNKVADIYRLIDDDRQATKLQECHNALVWIKFAKNKKWNIKKELKSYKTVAVKEVPKSIARLAAELFSGIRKIQKLMRHKSIASTLVYANLSPESLRDASERLNFGPLPAPKLKKK